MFGTNPNIDEVFEYLDSDPHQTIKETFDMVERAEEKFEAGEFAQYVIRPKSGEPGSGEIAGTTGVYPKWDRRFATFGIMLDKRFWGRAYSAERAGVFIEFVFEQLDLDLVAVKYIDGNSQSKRAIEKYVERFGGQYDGLLRNWLAVNGDVFDCHRYTISKEQYEESTKS